MTGRFTIVAIPTSAVLVIAATTAALIALWLPLNDFPATYTYQRVPNLLYTYASGSATASCSATSRFNDVLYAYTCRGGTSPLPTGTMTNSIDPRSLTLPFYLTSYVGRATLVPGPAYSVRYPPVSTPTVTVTVGATTSGARATSTPTSASLSRTDDGYYDSLSSSSASASAYLAGAAISTIAFAPTSTTFNIHIPHPKIGLRALMTAYCSIAMAISLFVFVQTMINLVVALYLWDRPQSTESVSETSTPDSTVEPRFRFSIKLQEDEDRIESRSTNESQGRLLKAWNAVPPSGVTGGWIIFTLPCLIIGLISIGVQASNLRDLPAFLAAGACGKQTSYFTTWERLICSGQRPSRLPGILTPASTNRPTNMQTYAWPLTVSLAMFAVAWVSLLFLFISVLIRLRVSRDTIGSRSVGGRRSYANTSNGAGASAAPFFTFAAFSDGGGGGHGAGGGGFGGGGGGGCGGGDGGGGGGGGGCC